jgi:hypothetical protein
MTSLCPSWVIRVDFGMSAACPVRRQSRKCRLSRLPVEGIGWDVIQKAARRPGSITATLALRLAANLPQASLAATGDLITLGHPVARYRE